MTRRSPAAVALHVPADDLWFMVHSTVRYALGRMTYVVNDACRLVRRYRSALATSSLEQIAREVRAELGAAEAQGRFVGMKMDHEQWRTLAADLELEIAAAKVTP